MTNNPFQSSTARELGMFGQGNTHVRPQDRRRAERKKVNARATIILLKDQSIIGCQIRNLTRFGAMLKLDKPQDLPELFGLKSRLFSQQPRCHKVWQKDDRVGLKFTQELTDLDEAYSEDTVEEKAPVPAVQSQIQAKPKPSESRPVTFGKRNN